MTDHADIVREALDYVAMPEVHRDAVAALDALVAEREEARRLYDAALRDHVTLIHQCEAAEAENVLLREALTKILYASENNQEMSIIARFDAIHAIARAVLSPTKVIEVENMRPMETQEFRPVAREDA